MAGRGAEQTRRLGRQPGERPGTEVRDARAEVEATHSPEGSFGTLFLFPQRNSQKSHCSAINHFQEAMFSFNFCGLFSRSEKTFPANRVLHRSVAADFVPYLCCLRVIDWISLVHEGSVKNVLLRASAGKLGVLENKG